MTAPLTGNVAVNFNATGVAGVQRGLRLVGSTGETTARQVGGSMRQIAGGVEMIARQGKVTGESLKSLISQGAEMAFMFGAAGPIVGAIAIVGVAIYEHITGKMKEAREEINKTRREFEGLGDFASAGRAQQRRYSGDPNALRMADESNAAYIARRYGIGGVRSRIEELRASLPANVVDRAGQGQLPRGLVATTVSEGAKELIELLKQLGRLKTEMGELAPILERTAAAEGERARTQVGLAAAEAAAARRGRTQEAANEFAMRLRSGPETIQNYNVGQSPIEGARAFMRGIGGPTAAAITPSKGDRAAKDILETVIEPMAATLRQGIGQTIGDAISAGFEAAFAKGANFGKVAAAFGASALSTIGGVFKDIGMQSLLGLQFMGAIKAAIASWNPALGIAASIGLIALGSALQSAGGRMAGNASGGGGGGGGGGSSGYYGGGTIIDRGFIGSSSGAVNSAANMAVRTPVVVHQTIIGPNDPVAQRMLGELTTKAARRGSL